MLIHTPTLSKWGNKSSSLEATLRITLFYAAFSASWILLSDIVVEAISTETHSITTLQTLKGWMFVAITALLLFVLIFRSNIRSERVFQMDGLTGLLNHNLFNQQLVRKIHECKQDHSIVMWCLDINNFKQLNEKVGFEQADQFLKAFASDLATNFDAETIIGRLAADQFAVSKKLSPNDSLEEKTEELKSLFTRRAYKSTLDISCSMGVASFPCDASTANELMAATNEALHNAKQQRDVIIYHDIDLAQAAQKRKDLLQDLKHAIEHNQLSLVYQPKYCLTTGNPTGVEILTRWKHPYRGYISPAEFIPLAEQNNLSHKITRFVVETAAAELKRVNLLEIPINNIALNVSASEFNNPKDMDILLEQILDNTELAHLIKVEITETATLNDMTRSAAIITKLRDSGLRFSVDDFGTGYTSLAMLKDFTIDEIKIDRSFISELEHEGKAKTIVAAIVAMASSFKINVVAEGVETLEQLKLLKEIGCQEVQGYFLGVPMNITKLKKHLKDSSNGPITELL